MDFRVAAKAFIVRDGKLFMMRRRANDPHKPGALDIPGGRLEPGESPFDGLKREVQEEISCEVEIIIPIGVNHFTRDDGQQITLIMFMCHLLDDGIKLSEEHQQFEWVDLVKERERIPAFFHQTIDNYLKFIHE